MAATSNPQTRDDERRRDQKPGSLGRELLVIVVVALALSVLVRTFIAQAFYVPSSSMENTLQIQDRILVSKLSTQLGGVNRGEIVVFTDPGGWLPPANQVTLAIAYGDRSGQPATLALWLDGALRPDGAAIPVPPVSANAASSCCATGCAGTRNPTVSWPPVTKSPTCAARGSTSVSGPGQNAAASRRAPSGTPRAQWSIAAAVATWTMTGWSAGRPLAANTRATARPLAASAPRP